MELLKLEYNAIIAGKTYTAGTQLRTTLETLEKGYREYEKHVVRQKMAVAGLTTDDILGLTNDVATYALFAACKVAAAQYQAIQQSTNVDEYYQKIKAFYDGNQDIAVLANTFITNVNSGETKLPALVKGEGVVQEIMQKSTILANIFTE